MRAARPPAALATLVAAITFAVAGVPTVAYGETPAVSVAPALERELAAEQEELRIAEEALARVTADADARQRELEAELSAADARIARARADASSAATDTSGETTPESAPLDIEPALPSARALIEQLDLQLREIPGGEASRAELKAVSAMLDDDARAAEGLTALAKLSTKLHAATTRVAIERKTIWTAKNVVEEVELLSTGTVAHAYRAPDGRLAIAVLSPEDASGFRWTEDLDPSTHAALSRAFDDVSKGVATPLVPIDPGSNLRAATGGERTFGDQFGDGGPVMWPLSLIALVALLLMLERLVMLYLVNRRDPQLLDEVLALNAQGEFKRAQALCTHRRGVVARTLSAVLRRHEQGQEAMEDTVQEQMLHELPRLQRFLGGLALLGGIAPLLGLLGTVTGIIDTFRVIHAFGNSDASMMAGGIAEALTTTATGLIIAVPIFVVHGLLKGRADRIVSDAERSAATLLNEVVRPVASVALAKPINAASDDDRRAPGLDSAEAAT